MTQFTTGDFVAVVEGLRAQGGFLKVVASRSDGSRRALGRDPSGNVIEILSR